MLKIHVCEDDELQRQALEKNIEEMIQFENADIKLGYVSGNPYEFLEGIESEGCNSLFFLDVDLKQDMNGLELAQKLREKYPRCYIVFVTTHSEMSYMTFTYKVEAMDYIIKDDSQEIKNRVYQCIIHATEVENKSKEEVQEQKFIIKIGSKRREIAMSDILFFEVSAESRKVILHAKDSICEFSAKMKEIEEKVPYNFYRCHRGFIVNVDYIDRVEFDEGEVYMINGESCPLSVRMGKGLKKIL